ncbi:head protein [Haloarcula hispanica icosahedral virus 2]|uniref:VP12 n=1 Tax=Haloarcula hispanica icosahedral virus 2 TaxID=1154689 RepID=H9AZX0_9VIRU|nr:head protein [Haloarcula hispanica icosahedral virus 2]AFD02295.1 VP12 [Haloarcula hispanica icosahedral virus 2]
MASINVNRATSTLMSTSFLKSAVMIVVGSLLAQVVTDYLRSNVRDINMAGGDAVYSAVAALLVLTVLPKKYGKPLALGSMATSVRVMLRELGVV